MAKPNKNASLGQGGRFAAGMQDIMAEGKSKSMAAAIMGKAGMKKYGKARMAKMSAAGRKRKSFMGE